MLTAVGNDAAWKRRLKFERRDKPYSRLQSGGWLSYGKYLIL